jgi:hypothetical protein
MALMDKMKAQATQLAQKAQEAGKAGQAKVEDVQAKRHADALLRELGAAVFAQRSGKGGEDRTADIDRIIGELTTLESESGQVSAASATDTATGSAAPSAGAAETSATPEGGFKLD